MNAAGTRAKLAPCGYTSGWYPVIFWTIVALHVLLAAAVIRRTVTDLTLPTPADAG